jgi:hypothetical protein
MDAPARGVAVTVVERVLFYVGAAVCLVYSTGVLFWHFPYEKDTVVTLSALLGIQFLYRAGRKEC